MTNALKVEISDKWSKEYYSSKENTLRSLNTFYSHNVLGKRKYLSIRKANQRACYKKQSVPNYVPYNKLAMHINQVDIDTLLPISDLVEVNNNETFTGAYRNPAQYILRLAKFYLFVNKNRHDKLKVFPYFKKKNEDSFLFCVSIGGDSAPICGMSILVSFLNVGSRIASSDEQFTLFGADVSENSIIVSKFIEKLVVDMKYLEKETFSIDIEGDFVQAEFAFSELPNDMKMLSFLAGELSNSSFYFSTFANATQTDSNDYTKSFGKHEQANWKPFAYEKRLKDAENVRKKKVSLEKSNNAESTKRSKITSYI